MLVELELHATAGVSELSDSTMLILKEKNGKRILPILTSTHRATVLMMRQKLSMPFPLPASIADLDYLLMKKFNIAITRVELTFVRKGIFFANVVAEREGQEETVENCQAADALVMAITASCPIMVEEELLAAQYMRQTSENSFAVNINVLSRQMLEDALEHAVESEDFETASRLRDELAKRMPLEDTAEGDKS